MALAGPPCSGKSSTGRLLAEILNVEFLETDSLVEESAGKSIADIFRDSGETEFRTVEKKVTEETILSCRNRSAVVSLGGGTLLDPGTRILVESECTVFTLAASANTLLSRNTGGRPLSGDGESFRKLLKERTAHYLSLPGQVATENRSPGEIARLLARELRKEDRSL